MSRYLFCILVLFSQAGALAAGGARRIHQPEADLALTWSSAGDQMVLEADLAGKKVRLMIGMEEPVSWLRPGVAATPPLEDPGNKQRWVLADLTLEKARITGEPFLLREEKEPVLPEGCQGVIGHSTLREFCVTFDFSASRLILHPPGKPPSIPRADLFALDLQEKTLRVPGTDITIASGRTVLPLWVNEKAEVPFIAATIARRPPHTVPRALLDRLLPDMVAKGAADSVRFPSARLKSLAMRDVTLGLTGNAGEQKAGSLNLRGLGQFLLTFNYAALQGGLRNATGDGVHLKMPDIGLDLDSRAGVFYVTAVEAGSPAEKAGIKPGDRVRRYLGVLMSAPGTPEMAAVSDRTDDPVTLTWQRGEAEEVTSTISRRAPPAKDPLIAGYERHSSITDAPVVLPFTHEFSGMVVTVQVNGQPARMVLDTGANVSVLGLPLAKRLGITPRTDGQITGINGLLSKGHWGVAERMEIGAAVITREPVYIADLPEPFEALLGMSTLRDYDVRIDPGAGRMTLWPAGKAPAQPGETALPLEVKTVNHAPQVTNPQRWQVTRLLVPVAIGGQKLQADLDTGATHALQISSALTDKLIPGLLAGAPAALSTGVGLSGTIASRSIKLPEFQFGPDTLQGLPADAVDIPKESSMGELVLGNAILRHYVLTLCLSAGQLRLLPLGTVQDVTKQSTAGIFMGDRNGEIFVRSLAPDGAGERAGLQVGDIILEINGIPLKTMKPTDLAALKLRPPGTAVPLKYRREDAAPVVVTVILQKE